MSSPCEKPDSLTDALAKAGEELTQLMNGGLDALGSVGSKIGEMGSAINAELSEAATEINDFQTKLNEALNKSGAEFSKAIAELNNEFGEAMNEIGVDINEALQKVGVELDKIPTLDEILNMGIEELSKLKPNVNTSAICDLPKVELTPEGKATIAAAQPLLPKVGPLMANFKLPETSAESNPTRKAVWVYTGSSKDIFNEIKESYIEEVKTKAKNGNWYSTKKVLSPENKQKLKAETYYYYVELSKILGIPLMNVHMATKSVSITQEQADATGVSKTNYINKVKERYEFNKGVWSIDLSFENAVKEWQKQYTEPSTQVA